jgi:hypothetical protein
MSQPLFSPSSPDALRHLYQEPSDTHNFQAIVEHITTDGLGVRVNRNGYTDSASTEYNFGPISGGETQQNLNALENWIRYLNMSAEVITLGLFRERLTPHVQADNRSVAAAFNRLNHDSVNAMLSMMVGYIGKDIKLPLRALGPIVNGSWSHYEDPDIRYTEDQTGTYHTLLPQGVSDVRTISCYLEDQPVVRRYLRYIDSIARRHGIRLVYLPKHFAHLEEIDTVSSPTLHVEDGAMRRRINLPDGYKALFVSLAFDYRAFSHLTLAETAVQPEQRQREPDAMCYGPVFVEYLDSIIQVLKQLGGFSSCKIFYKAFRTHARS